jgi:hypothetical protein
VSEQQISDLEALFHCSPRTPSLTGLRGGHLAPLPGRGCVDLEEAPEGAHHPAPPHAQAIAVQDAVGVRGEHARSLRRPRAAAARAVVHGTTRGIGTGEVALGKPRPRPAKLTIFGPRTVSVFFAVRV